MQDLHKLGVQEGDLLHMDNTVQMHKPVPQAAKWRSVVFVHDHWKQRLYYLPTEETGVKERLRAKQVRVTAYCHRILSSEGVLRLFRSAEHLLSIKDVSQAQSCAAVT